MRDRISELLLLAALAACHAPPAAPERDAETPATAELAGASAELNARFLDPELDVEEFVRTFEGESREIARAHAAITRAIALEPGTEVADVGAGTGLFLHAFSRAVGPGGRVLAVEISPVFVEHLRERARAIGADNVDVVLCTDRSVELPRASIDVAFVCDTYHHFEHPSSTLASLSDALRPGGSLYVLDFERIPGVSRPWVLDHVRAGKSEVRAEIEASGFRYAEEIRVPGLLENYLLRFERPRR